MSRRWHEVHAHLLSQTARLSFQRQFEKLCWRHAALDGFSDPAAVLGRLHDRGGALDRKDDVLRALVTEAQTGGAGAAVAQVLIQLALWPGLDALRWRLQRHFPDGADAMACELTAGLADAIGCVDLDKVNRLAATLLRNLERDIRRTLIRTQRPGALVEPDAIADPQASRFAAYERLRSALKTHLGADGDLVFAVDVAGWSQKEAADRLGLTHAAARKRTQRGRARLAFTLGEKI